MDGHPCRRFFLDPELTFHRRYEALRAFFVEDRPVAEIASQFGYKPNALNVMISRFHAQFRRGPVRSTYDPAGLLQRFHNQSAIGVFQGHG